MSLLGDKTYTLDRSMRLLIRVTCGIIILMLLRYLSEVLFPFALALGMAYIINPLVSWLEHKLKRRGLAVVLTLGLLLATMVVFIAFAGPRFMTEGKQMLRLLKEMGEQSELTKKAAERLPPELWDACREWFSRPSLRAWLQQEEVTMVLRTALMRVVPSFLGVLKGSTVLLASLLGLIVIGLYFIFILLDYGKISEGLYLLFPSSMRDNVHDFVTEFDAHLSRYFRAQAFVAALVGLLFGIGFAMLGLPMPWLLGLMMAVLNLVPYMQMLGCVPVVFLALVKALETGETFAWMGSMVLLVFVVVQMVQDLILVPRIMGRASGLSPAIILLSLSVWAKLLGFLGLIVAIPATCLCWVWYRRIVTQDLQVDSDKQGLL
jgi:predicted PurR-regulated permease PerM